MRLFVFLLSIAFTTGINAEEKITSFHSSISIEADGSLLVLETIEAQVEGLQIKRGILRDFPTDYRDRYGRRVTVPFEVLYVRRDGRGEPWTAARQRNGVSLRIGNAYVLLPPGVHVFEIAYRTRYQLGFFGDHDELYWNVNGNGWTFAMDQVSADVTLPAAAPRAPAAQIKVEAYTGAFGAKGRDYAAEAIDGGARFEATRRLERGEGLTIVFMFPKGIIAEPTLREKFGRWLHDNTGEAVGAAGLLVFLSFLYWRWSVVGRDPRSGPVFPRYEAPAGLGPAGARYLDRMECDDRCFAAALLGLGQRGALKIRKIDGGFLGSDHYRIEPVSTNASKQAALQTAALPGEQPITAMLAGGAIDIGRKHDPKVEQARDGVKAELESHYGEKLFSKNVGSQFVALLIGAAALGAMFALEAATIAIVAAGAVVLLALVIAGKLLPAYTEEGRRMEDEVEGLRQYLSVAEKDDLAREKRPPRSPEEFAKFLPYAVALGVEKTWADAFAAVLGSAALSAAVSSYYYTGDHGGFGSVGGFTDSIADMGRTISAASTAPGSSSGGSSSGGGGGGGSSGGGGGGGGGSGW